MFAKDFASTHILLPQRGHEFIEFLKFIGVIKIENNKNAFKDLNSSTEITK